MKTIMQDVFTLFAKFPQKSGVEAVFNKGKSDIAGYEAFKTSIQNLEEHSLITDIKHFVFGVNEDVIKKAIKSISDFYLFIDYGDINSDLDGYNRRTSGLYLAATVAVPFKEKDADMADQVLLNDLALGYLLQIKDDLIKNQKKHPWLKDISDNHDISPFVARELNGSIGWTLTFRREGVDFV